MPRLRDADILELKEAGLSEQVIIAKTKSSRGMYELNTDDLVKLKAAGLSDSVINAMINAPTR